MGMMERAIGTSIWHGINCNHEKKVISWENTALDSYSGISLHSIIIVCSRNRLKAEKTQFQ